MVRLIFDVLDGPESQDMFAVNASLKEDDEDCKHIHWDYVHYEEPHDPEKWIQQEYKIEMPWDDICVLIFGMTRRQSQGHVTFMIRAYRNDGSYDEYVTDGCLNHMEALRNLTDMIDEPMAQNGFKRHDFCQGYVYWNCERAKMMGSSFGRISFDHPKVHVTNTYVGYHLLQYSVLRIQGF